MYYNRRKFIKTTGAITAGIALAPLTDISLFSSKKVKDFGIQLYTLRDDLPKDPKGILKQVASFGYKQIESFETNGSMFFGMSNTDFKKYMDELGMTIIASHCDISKDFEKKAADAAAIGIKYLLCAWKGPQKSIDDFKRIAEDFNHKVEICRKNGIRFGYHNHDYSFKPLEGQIPQDVLMNNTDSSLVDFELDIYWVVTAGQDPVTWLKKYPNRYRLSHIKDRIKGATESDASCTLGKGSIDFASIYKVAAEQGMEYFFVEQEKYDGTTPIKAVEANAGYMKKLVG